MKPTRKLCFQYRGKYVREISPEERTANFQYRWIALCGEGKLTYTLKEAYAHIDAFLEGTLQHAA